MSKVINLHHCDKKLPPNTVYIGRPSPYGNKHSSKSGLNTKEECIALHRVDLYLSLIEDATLLPRLQTELAGKDLACWCKQPKKIVGCHGDNFLHVLSQRLISRTYDRTVLYYLMDDLRFCLDFMSHWTMHDADSTNFLRFYIHFGDVRMNIQDVVRVCRVREVPPETICYLIATIVVDLELAMQETDLGILEYRLNHILWICDRFINKRLDRKFEPPYPTPHLKRPSKKEDTP